MKVKYGSIIIIMLFLLSTIGIYATIPLKIKLAPISLQQRWSINLPRSGASISSADLDSDGFFEILFPSYDNNLYCFNYDGSLKWVFPATHSIGDSPCIADIDGDNYLDIVFYASHTIYCLNHNGTLKWVSTSIFWISHISLSDIDNNKSFEILITGSEGVSCFDNQGLHRWTVNINQYVMWSRFHLADVDGNGNIEILFTNSYNYTLFCVNCTGQVIWRFWQWGIFLNEVVAGDLDGDNCDDIIAYSGTSLYCINQNGFLRWEYPIDSSPEAEIKLLDIDNDGDAEIVFFNHNDEIIHISKDGNLERKINAPSDISFNHQASVADLDNDGVLEHIIPGYFALKCVSYSGQLVFSIYTPGSYINGVPCIIDLDGDKVVEIIFVSIEYSTGAGKICCYELANIFQSGKCPWYCYEGSVFNTGFRDTDSDLLDDKTELFYNTSKINNDTDSDGLNDGIEILSSRTDPLLNDTDFDGLLDGWEVENGLNPLLDDSSDDPDNDNLTNLEEALLGTNPQLNDTDSDGLIDGDEVNIHITNPLLNDTDFDGLNDYEEIFIYFTLPQQNDTDLDGILDGWEVTYGLNPLVNDSTDDPDSDGLINLEEYTYASHPFLNDTDNDGLIDGDEVYIYLTNPLLIDTDSDELSDYEEVFIYFTTPYLNDTDSDDMPDGWEVHNLLNPLVNDSMDDPDADGLNNLGEFTYDVDPTLNDTDSDDVLDGDEVFTYFTSPSNNDTDFDELLDGEEIFVFSTNATNPDTDGDNMPDGWEVHNLLNPLLDDAAADNDVDGLTNFEEYQLGTIPINNDTDSDGMLDGWEDHYHLDPLIDDANNDNDGDSLTNYEEYILGTSPIRYDTDRDGMDDFYEFLFGLDPLIADANADLDNDGLLNIYEYQIGSLPNNTDTDSDGMPDGWEYYNALDPLIDDASEDPDADGLTNILEFQYQTDPQDEDTDDDGMLDGDEIAQGFNPLNPNSNLRSREQLIKTLLYIASAIAIVMVALFLGKLFRRRLRKIKMLQAEAAVELGFASTQEQEYVQSLGFETKIEYDTLRSLGFENMADYLSDQISVQLHKVWEKAERIEAINQEIALDKTYSELKELHQEIDKINSSLTSIFRTLNEYILSQYGDLKESWNSSITKIQSMKKDIRLIKKKIQEMMSSE